MAAQARVPSYTNPALSGHLAGGFSFLVSDAGDEHEMNEDFGKALARAGDRLGGFAMGAGLLAAAWVIGILV
jgi:hypothetical protein